MKRGITIYLAGKMGGISHEEAMTWRKIVGEDIKAIETKRNVTVVNPANYYNFQEKRHDTEREVMTYDIDLVTQSDIVIVRFSSPVSIGTEHEIAIANHLGIPVIGLNDNGVQLHPWETEVCRKIFYDIPSLTEYIKDFYLSF